MKQKVIIKSNKYGLIVHMDPDAEYTEILKELREKFTESARFFKDATMAVTFEGRILTKPQEEEVIGLITDVAHIHIVCIFDANENTERLYKKVVEDSPTTRNSPVDRYKCACRQDGRYLVLRFRPEDMYVLIQYLQSSLHAVSSTTP